MDPSPVRDPAAELRDDLRRIARSGDPDLIRSAFEIIGEQVTEIAYGTAVPRARHMERMVARIGFIAAKVKP